MKKNVFHLMLVELMLFSFVSIVKINAQVTIGKDTIPHPGAVLELRSNKGLLLPRVNLNKANDFLLSSNDKDKAVGMIVYNTNRGMTDGKGEGVYVWNGSEWTLMAMTGRNILLTKITISTVGGATTVPVKGTLQFKSAGEPVNASNSAVKWSVLGAGSIDGNGLFTAGTQEGEVTIIAESVDGSKLSDRKTIKVTAANTPGFHKENGYDVYTLEENGERVTWMVENSREGNPALKAYKGKAAGERGYYYSWSEANSACPSGFRLPTVDEINSLLKRVKNSGEKDNAYWTNDSSKAGLYYNNDFIQWGDVGYWWTNEKDKVSYWDYKLNQTGVAALSVSASVRCVKKENN